MQLIFAAIFFVNAIILGPESQSKNKTLFPQYIAGEILLSLKSEYQSLSYSKKLAVLNILLKKNKIDVLKIKKLKVGAPFFLIKITEPLKLQYYIHRLNQQKEVDFAEPNYILKLFDSNTNTETDTDGVIPNDPLLEKSWSFRNTGQVLPSGKIGKPGADINIVSVWNKSGITDQEVIVAVIDTGIDWNHEDLKENLYTNPGEAGALAINGIDDDRNGYIDDVHGWNFVKNNSQSQDDNRHGTHCAGIIGAKTNNQLGIAGVHSNVRLLPVKFIDRDGSGATSDAIEGMHYASKIGAKIFNSSWGSREYSKALRQAVERAHNEGVLFVAAAGNSKSDNDLIPSYPSSFKLPNIISVAASDNNDHRAYFSNFGKNSVHVFAPGLEIFSTLPNNQYGYLSGTSMASPHVAGMAALILSLNPGMTHLQIKDRILASVDSIYGLKAFVATGGRVNVAHAVNNIDPIDNDPDEDLWKDFPLSLSSEHPYPRNAKSEYLIQIPGAKKIRLYFKKIEFELIEDVLRIEDENGLVVQELTGSKEDLLSDYVLGGSLKLNLSSNDKLQKFGFEIEKAQYISHSNVPMY